MTAVKAYSPSIKILSFILSFLVKIYANYPALLEVARKTLGR